MASSGKAKNDSFSSSASGPRETRQTKNQARNNNTTKENPKTNDPLALLLEGQRRMEERMEKMDEKMDSKLDKVLGELDKMKKQLTELKNRLQVTESKVSDLEKARAITDKKIAELQNEIKELKEQGAPIASVTSAVEKIQREMKASNIIIKGLPEANDEPAITATRFLKDTLKADMDYVKVKLARFINFKPGHVLLWIKLKDKNSKLIAYESLRNLKGTPYSIVDDLTPKQMENRNILLMKRREILDNKVGKVVKVYDESMSVDGEWYDLINGEVVKRSLSGPSESK